MALVLKDRVKETTTSTGTGTITLAGAVAGYQSFSVIGNANTTYYVIADSVSGAWEVGIGTYTASGTTLARNTVLASSNANALVNFPAGEKEVFVTYPAGRSVYVDGTTIVPGTAATLPAVSGGTGQSSYAVGDLLYASGTTALSKLAGVATGNVLLSGGVATAPSWGKVGLTTHISGTLAIGNGGTGVTGTPTNGQLLIGNGTGYTLATISAGTGISVTNGAGTISIAALNNGTVTGVTATAPVASSGGTAPVISLNAAYGDTLNPYGSKTANFVLAAPNGSNGVPSFRALVAADIPNLTLDKLPDAWVKRSVRVATTANITLSAPQTIDGIAVVAGDRVLVKNQATSSQNGIYVVAAGAWTRATDADTSAELAGAVVAVDSGTANGGLHFDTDFKSTDTVGTTAMLWYRVVDTNLAVTSGSATTDAYVRYNGTTATAGQFDGGTTTPTGTTRLNYGGYFYPTFINLVGSADTATAATHYFVETGSDGFVRPKTLANVRTEIVTQASIGGAIAPSTSGNVLTSNGTSWISAAPAAAPVTPFTENLDVVSTNYTIATGKNALSVGPMTINSGVVVTVSSGQRWLVV